MARHRLAVSSLVVVNSGHRSGGVRPIVVRLDGQPSRFLLIEAPDSFMSALQAGGHSHTLVEVQTPSRAFEGKSTRFRELCAATLVRDPAVDMPETAIAELVGLPAVRVRTVAKAARRLPASAEVDTRGLVAMIDALRETTGSQPSAEWRAVPDVGLLIPNYAYPILDVHQPYMHEYDDSFVFVRDLVAALQPALLPPHIAETTMKRRPTVLLAGASGVGKTRAVVNLAAIAKAPLVIVSGHGGTMDSSLLGIDVIDDGKIVFRDGPVALAIRHGMWLLIDEISMIPPEYLAALHQAAEGGVVEINGRPVTPHPAFRLFATSNCAGPIQGLSGYTGNRPLPKQIMSRFGIKVVVGRPSADTLLNALMRVNATLGTDSATGTTEFESIEADEVESWIDARRRIGREQVAAHAGRLAGWIEALMSGHVVSDESGLPIGRGEALSYDVSFRDLLTMGDLLRTPVIAADECTWRTIEDVAWLVVLNAFASEHEAAAAFEILKQPVNLK